MDWLDDEASSPSESTVDEAWQLLRSAWRAKRAGNEAWSHSAVEESARNYTAGLRCAARAARFVDLDALEETDRYCFERFQSALHMVEAVLHRNLSLTSHHQADFTAALEHAEESLRLEPQNVKSKYRRGLALWALGRSEEGRKDLKDVLAKEPKNLELRRLLSGKAKEPTQRPETERAAAVDPMAPATETAQRCGECGLCWLAEDGGAGSPEAALVSSRRKGGRSALHWAALGGAWGSVLDPETRRIESSGGERGFNPFGWRRLGACPYWRLEALIDCAEVRKEDDVMMEVVDALDQDERSRVPPRGLLDFEETPLHLAAAHGQLEAPAAVSLLMDASALVDPLDRHGRSPLYYAAVGNHREVVALLVDRGHADQSILFRALKETSLEGRKDDLPLRPVDEKGWALQWGAKGFRVARDIDAFRWDWLKNAMGQREPQMCQLFCGSEGFSPCHYDPQDNVFLQVTGYKLVAQFLHGDARLSGGTHFNALCARRRVAWCRRPVACAGGFYSAEVEPWGGVSRRIATDLLQMQKAARSSSWTKDLLPLPRHGLTLPPLVTSIPTSIGEDTTQAMLEPPESSGVHTTDAVNKAWKMKVEKFTRIVTYFGGGLVVGGVATLLRRSVQEYCPPGSFEWSKLCDPTSWFEEEEDCREAATDSDLQDPKAATTAAATAAGGTAAAAGASAAGGAAAAGAAKGKGKGKAKVKAKAKAKARADAESSSYEDED
eukprot:s1311_g6.t1